jgi:hypothetical protein
MLEHARRVADQRDGIAGGERCFDQRLRIGILGEVPQRAMAARIKHAVEPRRVDLGQDFGRRQLRLRGAVALEAAGRVGLGVGGIALGIERRLTPFGLASVMSCPASFRT